MIKNTTSFKTFTKGTPSPEVLVLLREANEHDGERLAIQIDASVIKYGRGSLEEYTMLFEVHLTPSELISPDGQKTWPFNGELEEAKKFASKFLLPEDAKCGIYRGHYDCAASKIAFDLDGEPTHILFASDKGLCTAGKLYGVDVIRTRRFNAVAIPNRTAVAIMHRWPIYVWPKSF